MITSKTTSNHYKNVCFQRLKNGVGWCLDA